MDLPVKKGRCNGNHRAGQNNAVEAISILEIKIFATVEAIFSSNTEYRFHAHLRY